MCAGFIILMLVLAFLFFGRQIWSELLYLWFRQCRRENECLTVCWFLHNRLRAHLWTQTFYTFKMGWLTWFAGSVGLENTQDLRVSTFEKSVWHELWLVRTRLREVLTFRVWKWSARRCFLDFDGRGEVEIRVGLHLRPLSGLEVVSPTSTHLVLEGFRSRFERFWEWRCCLWSRQFSH